MAGVGKDTNAVAAEGSPREYRASILFSLARYLEDEYGPDALQAAAQAGGLTVEQLGDRKSWLAIEPIEAFCDHAAQTIGGGEASFRSACMHRLHEAYGPLRYVAWATSPQSVCKVAMRNMHLVHTTGRYQLLEQSKNGFIARYTCGGPQGRLVCLIRQANFIAMPTFWGLPPAEIGERSCIGHGDDACTYVLRFPVAASSQLPRLLGLGLGLGAGSAIAALGLAAWPVALALPALGWLSGNLIQQKRQNRANLDTAQRAHSAVEELANQEAQARLEVMSLLERQSAWTSLMEKQLASRTATLEDVIAGLNGLQEERVTMLRGVSHDIRSPLSVIRANAEMAKMGHGRGASAEEQIAAVDRIDAMLSELSSLINSERKASMRHERLSIDDITEQIRGQLQALAFGKEIRTTAFSTREAPAAIKTDLLYFWRVIDNVLSNAAKYTSRGSIIVELDGKPGYLALKISDTGRGISSSQLGVIFHPGGSCPETRVGHSQGLGLSVVVRLLRDVGGKLEMMSKPEVGTTIWLYWPIEPVESDQRRPVEEHDEMIESVVTIRQMAS
jgi:signal transduction histidine kinase